MGYASPSRVFGYYASNDVIWTDATEYSTNTTTNIATLQVLKPLSLGSSIRLKADLKVQNIGFYGRLTVTSNGYLWTKTFTGTSYATEETDITGHLFNVGDDFRVDLLAVSGPPGGDVYCKNFSICCTDAPIG